MELRDYPLLGEKAYWDTLENGLTVAVIPRTGFTRKIAYFVTDFGAIHRRFKLDGKEYALPAGTAHFLEHKLFDMPDIDVSARFAALGAIPNAFTSYDMTAYYFSCTENFNENLSLLLKFVSTPYFTEESVAKERDIIGHEIDMVADTPDSKLFENLMAQMYRQHPVRQPILGTKESLEEITPQVLQLCHRAFYQPSNMLLCVVGDVNPEEVREIACAVLPNEAPVPVEKLPSEETSLACENAYGECAMEVAMPMFQLGFKCPPVGQGPDAVLREIIGDLAAEALFGESSELYLQLYQQGIIDGSFGGGFETIDGMALFTVSGDSDTPLQVQQALLEQASRIARQGIPPEDFTRLKRSALGRRIKALDSFDSVAFRTCAYHLSHYDYFRFPELYRQVTARQVQEFIQKAVDPAHMSMWVIHPLQKEAM